MDPSYCKEVFLKVITETLSGKFDSELHLDLHHWGQDEFNEVRDEYTRDLERYMLKLYGKIRDEIELCKNGYRCRVLDGKCEFISKDLMDFYGEIIRETNDSRLYRCTGSLNDIISDDRTPLLLRFACFIFRFTVIRIEDYPLQLDDFVKRSPGIIKKQRVFAQYELNAYTVIGNYEKREGYILKRIESLEPLFNDNVAAINVCADIISEYSAHGLLEEPEKSLIPDYIDKLNNGIMTIEDHPTYHVILGKLYCENGDYVKAKEEVNVAIDSYHFHGREQRILSIRNTFNYIDIKSKTSIESDKLKEDVYKEKELLYEELKEQQKNNEDTIKELNSHYITTMAIITTMISIIVTSMSMAGNVATDDAIKIIVTFSIVMLLFIILLKCHMVTFLSKKDKNKDKRRELSK